MSAKPHSATLVCRPDDRDWVDRLSCALDYAPYDANAESPAARTMVIALSGTGRSPATFWAAHSRADDAFVALFEAAGSGHVPEQPQPGRSWEEFGLTRQVVIDLVSRITVRIVPNEPGAPSWRPTLDELGLARVQDEQEIK